MKFIVKKIPLLLLLVITACAETETTESNNKENGNEIPVEDTLLTPPEITLEDSLSDTTRTENLDTDEDENCDEHFRAAMNRSKPEDVVIVHCSYWSSEHPVWLEHSYSFELEKNDAFFEDLVDYNQMVKIQDHHEIELHQSNWFLPKEGKNYEGFYTEDDFDDFQIFKDLKTGHIFIRGSQY